MRRGTDLIILPSHRQSSQLILIHKGVSLLSIPTWWGGGPGEPGSRLHATGFPRVRAVSTIELFIIQYFVILYIVT